MFFRIRISTLSWYVLFFLCHHFNLSSQENVYFYILHSQEGVLKQEKHSSKGELLLRNVDESIVFFPHSKNGHPKMVSTKQFINFWSMNKPFFNSPPIGILVAYSKSDESFVRAVGRLSYPRYNLLEHKISFNVTWFDTNIPKEAITEVSLLVESNVFQDS